MNSFEAACKVVNYMIDILNSTMPEAHTTEYRLWSYSMFAAEEILTTLSNNPTDNFEDILDVYILNTERYMSMSDGKPSYEVFETANDTARDILQYLKQIYKGE